MSYSVKYALMGLTLSVACIPFATQAGIIELEGTLSAANQDGSDPALVAGDIVPTSATGVIKLQLDDGANLLDIQLSVLGIAATDLIDFGPNQTSIHLHNAGGGSPGNFGPISIDPTVAAQSTVITPDAKGFTALWDDVSILALAQGGVGSPNMHPGDDAIVAALLSGNMFVAVHTAAPIGFPNIEIRGNFQPVSAVPVPAALPLLGSGLLGLLAWARRRA